MKDLILILSKPIDVHADMMVDHLRQRNVKFERLHPGDLPLQGNLSLQFAPGRRVNGCVTAPEVCIDLGCIKSVWRRQTDDPQLPVSFRTDEAVFARSEVAEALFGYLALTDAFWVNPPSQNRVASCKPVQLEVARQIGFRIPNTLITNSPVEARAFFDECKGRVVYKTLTQGKLGTTEGRFVFTSRVLREDLEDFKAITCCSCQFQEDIEKSLDLRITVIGRRVFAVEIHSQVYRDSRQDWRRMDVAKLPHAIHTLPDPIISQCRKLLARFGLNYGAIDMLVTPNGDYVFLEINPSGQFGWLEQKTGLRLTEAMADLLVAGDLV